MTIPSHSIIYSFLGAFSLHMIQDTKWPWHTAFPFAGTKMSDWFKNCNIAFGPLKHTVQKASNCRNTNGQQNWVFWSTKNLKMPWFFKIEFTWVFPKIGVPQNGWFIMENPIKMDDLGVPLFLETPTWIYIRQDRFLAPADDGTCRLGNTLLGPGRLCKFMRAFIRIFGSHILEINIRWLFPFLSSPPGYVSFIFSLHSSMFMCYVDVWHVLWNIT